MTRANQTLRLTVAFLAASAYADVAPAATQEACTTDVAPFGCRSEASIDRLAELRPDKDAFVKAAILFVAAGECATFHAGETVYVEDRAWLSERRKVRRKGELTSYWTLTQETIDGPCQPASAPVSAPVQAPRAPLKAAAPVHYPTGPSAAQPLRVGQEVDDGKCHPKSVMTDEEIARCEHPD